MVATELIHFPLWAQLSPRQSLPARTPFEPAGLISADLREANPSGWKYGGFKQLRILVRSERDRSV
jgi:hypothetical protein